MPKFVFNLQPMLNIKLQQEDLKKNELGKAIARLEQEKQMLIRLEEQKEQAEEGIAQACLKGTKVDDIKKRSIFLDSIKERIKLQKENINEALKIVDIYREELTSLMQERKMLEKLKEKKYSDYLQDNNREEIKLSEEITSYKFTRGKVTERSQGGSNGSNN